MRRYTEEEVTAILSLVKRYGIDGALSAYKRFENSVYNIPYRDVEICLKNWEDAQKMHDAQHEFLE